MFYDSDSVLFDYWFLRFAVIVFYDYVSILAVIFLFKLLI